MMWHCRRTHCSTFNCILFCMLWMHLRIGKLYANDIRVATQIRCTWTFHIFIKLIYATAYVSKWFIAQNIRIHHIQRERHIFASDLITFNDLSLSKWTQDRGLAVLWAGVVPSAFYLRCVCVTRILRRIFFVWSEGYRLRLIYLKRIRHLATTLPNTFSLSSWLWFLTIQ